MNDSHEITSRLLASIVRVNKLTKLEPIRGRDERPLPFFPCLDLHPNLYGFIAYLKYVTVNTLLVVVVKNWDSFRDSSMVIPAMVCGKSKTHMSGNYAQIQRAEVVRKFINHWIDCFN